MSTDSENLRINMQLNEIINDRNKLLIRQSSLITDQVELATKLCKAMKCEGIDEISDRISELRSGLEKAGQEAEKSSDKIGELANGLNKAAKEAGNTKDQIAKVNKQVETLKKVASGVFDIFKAGFVAGIDQFFAFIELAKSTVGAFFNIGKAILALPLAVFDVFMSKASELANGSIEIAQALEEVRKQYGDISKGFAKEVATANQSMAKSLGDAGLSISKVFGIGPGGTAAAIRASLDMAIALGPAVNLLGKNFGDIAGDLLVFQKGLGLSNEDLKSMIMSSKAFGQDVTKELRKVAIISEDLGAKFGMSSKDIARDVAFLTSQTGKFGKLTKEEMASASVSVRSFGLELKDVVGILDNFADFESAATNASKLAQSFGAIIDPMRLMKEENPAKAFEYLRKQMLQAGQSAETMNKAQIKQLATLSGMDENLVRTAFSSKNVGKSYEEIQKQADKSGKKQKSQVEVFESLGKSIERLIEQMQYGGSFISEFFQGFSEGFSRSKPVRQILRDLAQGLIAIRMLGREIGDVFANSFPGVLDMLESIHKFIGKGGLTAGVKDFGNVIRKFFIDLSKDPIKATEDFYNLIQTKVLNLFNTKSPQGSKFVAGFHLFVKTISGILAGLVNKIGAEVARGLKEIAAFIKNPAAAMKSSSSLLTQFFAPIIKSIETVAPLIGDALLDLISVIWSKYGKQFIAVFAAFMAFGIAKAMVLASIGVVSSALFNVAVLQITEMFKKLMLKSAPEKAIEGNSAIVEVSKSMGETIDNLADIKEENIKPAAKNLALAGTLLMGAAGAFIVAAGGVALIVAGFGAQTILTGLATIAAAGASLIPIAYAGRLLGKAGPQAAAAGVIGSLILMAALYPFMLAMMELTTLAQYVPKQGIENFAMIAAIGIASLIGAALSAYLIIAAMPDGGVAASTALLVSLLFMTAVGVWLAAFSGLILLANEYIDLTTIENGLAIISTALKALSSIALVAGVATVAMVGMTAAIVAMGSFILAASGLAAGAALLPVAAVGVGIMIGALVLIAKLSESVVDWINNAPDLNVTKALAYAAVFGTIMTAVGAIVVAAGTTGAFVIATLGAGAKAIDIGLGIIQQGFDSIKDNIPSIIKSIITVTSGISAEELKGKVDVVSSIISALGGMMSPIQAAAQMASKGGLFGDDFDVNEIGKIFGTVEDFISRISSSAVVLTMLLIGVTKDLTQDEIKGVEAGAKILGAISNIVGSFGSILSQIDFKADPENVKKATASMQALLPSLTIMLKGIGNSISTIISQIKTVALGLTKNDIKMLEPRIKIIASALNVVALFGETVSKLNADVKEGKDFSTTNLQNVAVAIAQSLDPNGTNNGLHKLMSAVSNISMNPDKMQKSIESLEKTHEFFNKYKDVVSAINDYRTVYGANVIGTIDQINQDLAEFDKLLSNISTVPVDVTIDRLAENLQIKREKIEMDHKPVQITLNMNVQFKAEEFVKDIFVVANNQAKKGRATLAEFITKPLDPKFDMRRS